ncbi:MAG: hypothetical protein AABX71_00610 [Nanoarchaeota archaeon]
METRYEPRSRLSNLIILAGTVIALSGCASTGRFKDYKYENFASTDNTSMPASLENGVKEGVKTSVITIKAVDKAFGEPLVDAVNTLYNFYNPKTIERTPEPGIEIK